MTRRSLGARRLLSALAYDLFARHLPWSPRPGGKVARRIRALLAAGMLDFCGQDVNIERGAMFGSGRGISVGDRSAIGLQCLVIGTLTVGNDVMMGPRCILVSATHQSADVERPMSSQGFGADRPILVEDDVWLGANVTVLPGVTIGRGSIVGAGSVVVKDVPPFSVAAGNPAKVIRSRIG